MSQYPVFDKYRNENGTVNGAAFFADVTGISQAEIMWTFNRLKELKAAGHSKEEMTRIVADECKSRPWESA